MEEKAYLSRVEITKINKEGILYYGGGVKFETLMSGVSIRVEGERMSRRFCGRW